MELLEGYKDVLTFKELQEILRLKRTKTYQLLQNNTIPSFKLGGDYRILKSSLIHFLQNDLNNNK